MIEKNAIAQNPTVKPRDLKKGNVVLEVPLLTFPAPTINIVLELVHPHARPLEQEPEFSVPRDAIQVRSPIAGLEVVVTFLGHEHNLLINPLVGAFVVKHHNQRFSANRPGWTYAYEAYGQ